MSDVAPPPSTRTAILDVAEALAQSRGFNGFSYADIAEQLGLTKATLHYHFRTKAELGRSILARYTETFAAALEAIAAQEGSARERLTRYTQIYAGVLRNDRLCLCGMFAAEYGTLPPEMQREVRRFFDLNEAWLTDVLARGRAQGELPRLGDPGAAARFLLDALEGAMLVARSYGAPERFEATAAHLLANLR